MSKHPLALRIGLAAMIATAGLSVGGLVAPTPVSAQTIYRFGPYFDPFDEPRSFFRRARPLSPAAIVDILSYEYGFRRIGRPRFDGELYVVDGVSQAGASVRAYVDAFGGRLIDLDVLRGPPRQMQPREAPPRSARLPERPDPERVRPERLAPSARPPARALPETGPRGTPPSQQRQAVRPPPSAPLPAPAVPPASPAAPPLAPVAPAPLAVQPPAAPQPPAASLPAAPAPGASPLAPAPLDDAAPSRSGPETPPVPPAPLF